MSSAYQKTVDDVGARVGARFRNRRLIGDATGDVPVKISRGGIAFLRSAASSPRSPPRLLIARVAYTINNASDLYRPFNRSILSDPYNEPRELSHAVTDPDSIPLARRIKSGRGCFAPVSLDRPICTASSFRSGKLDDWRLR